MKKQTTRPAGEILTYHQERGVAAKILSVCLIIGLLCSAPVMADAYYYGGYYVDPWSNGETQYYTVYQHSYEKMGTPDFYRESTDVYLNRQAGSDVRITFFQGYECPGVEKAEAFYHYLLEHSTAKKRYAGYYYYNSEYSGQPEYMYVYLIEGWDFDDQSLHIEDLLYKGPWDNGKGTNLELLPLGYGAKSAFQMYWDIGVSTYILVQKNIVYEGVAIGFKFTESRSGSVVRHYCGGSAMGYDYETETNHNQEADPLQTKRTAAGYYHMVFLRKDGTIKAVWDKEKGNKDGECDVSGWNRIVAVDAGTEHTVGLRKDGTVVATGKVLGGRCNVSGWRDIVAVAAGAGFSAGLRRDGTVVITNNYDVSGWRDIVAISAGVVHLIGLRSDGTVLAVGSNKYGQCDTSTWSGVVQITAGGYLSAGLKADGTVVAVGHKGYYKWDVSNWQNIKAITAGTDAIAGLKQDGTVLVTGDSSLRYRISELTDIAEIALGKHDDFICAIDSNGKFLARGYHSGEWT
ncbi:MAG: hypothetical protein K6C12_04540 [Oscillospiraceae bacterium]|nr:hypothetical protein [Oscillospiraceae bacterium]